MTVATESKGVKNIKSKCIKIKISSYDHRLVDNSVRVIADKMENLGVKFSVVPLPTKRSITTVVRSPHVYKESSEQFAIFTYKRLICIYTELPGILDKLSKISLPGCLMIDISGV